MSFNVRWIAKDDPKLSPWKYEEYTEERNKELKETAEVQNGSVLFRKDLRLRAPVSSARLEITGLGFYEVWLNGKKPDERRVFAPVLSDYYQLTRYDTYDVTDLLHAGANTLCAELGAGWFSPLPKWWGWQQFWYGNPRMAARLTVRYADGVEEVYETDETWRVHNGCITVSEMYDGEEADFRLVSPNWMDRNFDVSDWKCAIFAEAPTDNIVESYAPPIRIIRTLKPVKSWKLSETETVYDFGENGAAIPRVLARGHDGDMIQLDHAEFINEDGTLNRKSELGALCCDKFILTEGGTHLCGPRFIWHGYRYMKLTVSSPDIEILSVESHIVHSDLRTTGTFACSNERINLLHEMYVRTLKACVLGVPIDCPQRNERKAWLGDAHIVSEMAMYNFDMHDVYASQLEDMRIGRTSYKVIHYIAPIHIQFDDRTTIDYNVAYLVYLVGLDERYGDTGLMRYHYETLKEHLAYYERQCKDGFVDPCWFGDWFTEDMPEGMKKVDFKAGPEGHRQNPTFAGTMFYVQTLRLAAAITARIGETADADHYRKLRQISCDALNARCLDRETGKFGSGGQFLSSFALYENIVPEDCREAVFGELLRSLEEKDWHPWCGIVGNRVMYDVLCSFGRQDIAWKVLTVEGYPGPLHMLSNDRTTLTEGLNGWGSGCHNMFGAPDAMFYKMIAGITVNRRAENTVVVAPYFAEDLSWARATQELSEGTVSVAWERRNGAVELSVLIPEGVTAELRLPGRASEKLSAGLKNLTIK